MVLFSPIRIVTILFCLVVVFLIGLLFLVICDARISRQAREKTYASADEVPVHRVALVLGCAETLANGRGNLYFRHRIDAAAAAWRQGRCRYILVSGDNGSNYYNEPEAMRQALVRAGVPDQRIYSDYAGFRTLDSVVRAKEIFGQTHLLVISQRFHNERAIYIGARHGMTLTGLNAEDVRVRAGLRTRVREAFARVKTLLDLHLLETRPKFLGDPIVIAENSPQA